MIHNMRRPVPALLVSPGQREVLESVARSRSAPHRQVVRAKALLLAADGVANTDRREVGVTGDGAGGGIGSPRKVWPSSERSARGVDRSRRSRRRRSRRSWLPR